MRDRRSLARFPAPLVLAVGLGLGGFDSGSLQAAESATLGDGTLFTLRSVSLPAVGATALELELASSGGTQRLIVPGTEGFETEDHPALLYQEGTDTLFLLWQARTPSLHSTLHLSSYRRGVFEPISNIVAGPWSVKSAPQFVATQDSFEDVVDGAKVPRERTVLHLVWSENSGDEIYQSYYAPITLVDGNVLSTPAIYPLAAFDPTPPANLNFEVASQLLQSPRIEPGRDERSVTITFADGRSKRIATFEIDVLPHELMRLSDQARGHVIVVGGRSYATRRTEMAAEVAAWIRAQGSAFLPEVTDSLARGIQQLILSDEGTGSEGLYKLADHARGHVIVVGSRNRDRGLVKATASLSTSFAPLDEVSGEEGPLPSTGHALRIAVASSRPALRVSGDVRTFSSPDASRTLVAWSDGSRVRYRLSEDSGWSETLELTLGPSLSIEKAWAVLEQRVRPN